MPPKGHEKAVRRSVPGLSSLPRPVYGRTESLPNRALTRRHSHPWVQLSYAISGVLEIQTSVGRFVAPPQRAVWIPAGMPHRVFSSPHTEMRSLYLDCSVTAWAAERCQVLEVSSLLRELIRNFSQLPVEYTENGPDGRLAQVLLDQLAAAPQVDLMLAAASRPTAAADLPQPEPAPRAADHVGRVEPQTGGQRKNPQ